MREIKFEAWLLYEKEMGSVAAIEFRDKKVFIVRKDGRECWRMFSEIDLRQWTGLKDIKGIKIYEGDIVRYSGRNGNDNYEIIFDGGCFITKCITNPGDWNNDYMTENSLDFKDHWKIIGNRHETPDLLH